MVKSLIAPAACNAGRTTTRTIAMIVATVSSILEIWRFMYSALEAPALRDEDAGGTPLQKQDDHSEDEDFSEHRVEQDLLEALVNDADAEGADDGADEVADAADHHRHERIDD